MSRLQKRYFFSRLLVWHSPKDRSSGVLNLNVLSVLLQAEKHFNIVQTFKMFEKKQKSSTKNEWGTNVLQDNSFSPERIECIQQYHRLSSWVTFPTRDQSTQTTLAYFVLGDRSGGWARCCSRFWLELPKSTMYLCEGVQSINIRSFDVKKIISRAVCVTIVQKNILSFKGYYVSFF